MVGTDDFRVRSSYVLVIVLSLLSRVPPVGFYFPNEIVFDNIAVPLVARDDLA